MEDMENTMKVARVDIRLTEAEKKILFAAAQKRGIKPSELIRQFINENCA